MVPTIELVGDLVHVAPITLAAALSSRRPRHVACITDAVMDSTAEQHEMTYAGCRMSLKEM